MSKCAGGCNVTLLLSSYTAAYDESQTNTTQLDISHVFLGAHTKAVSTLLKYVKMGRNETVACFELTVYLLPPYLFLGCRDITGVVGYGLLRNFVG
jgi:hypothetical protein